MLLRFVGQYFIFHDFSNVKKTGAYWLGKWYIITAYLTYNPNVLSIEL